TSIGTEDDEGSADKWYYGVATSILDGLGIRVKLDEWWDQRGKLPALQRLTKFFSDIVLANTTQKVIIFVDEIDSTIKLPFADDFFAAIRACYNARATEAAYNRLSFVLLGVASPSDLIKDTARTPFNIGHRIDLTDFTFEEAKPLARGLGATDEHCEQALRRILHWTGGHPYLTQKLCQTAAADGADCDEARIDSAVEAELLSPQASLNDSNLNFVRDRMTKGGRLTPAMLKLYRRIRRGEKVIDDTRSPAHSGLKLSGLVVQREDRSLGVRNRVYERVFTDEWAKKAMPVDRRQRMAILSAAALLLIGFSVWYAVFLPRELIRELQAATDDYPAVAYAKLRRLPGFGGKADELLAQFWERRALREEGVGARNEALLSRLQAVSAKSSVLRRSEANRLVGPDYNNLLMTYRHGESVNAVAFSPDGQCILTGSSDGTARLWHVDSGQLISTLRHDLGIHINAIAFSPDGKSILTGSGDGTARLWRVDSGQLISTLRHNSSVNDIAFSPDGKNVMATTRGRVHFSSLTEGGLIHRLAAASPVPLMVSISIRATARACVSRGCPPEIRSGLIH
ncbi:MAG: AAA-like domain-containing protein, partial [Blastocatellia bacterium]